MEVPYATSGASFREQYTLASLLNSTTNADAEARKSIRQTLARLGTANLNTRGVKECLLLLMQAELALTHKSVSLEPALAHAIKLAEGGANLAERRIGYLFVQEHMRPNHPAALLLVNTIRKDLESSDDTRICLALSALVHLPNEDVIPAVRPLLKNLYRHYLPGLQRLALAAAASLGRIDASVLDDVLGMAPEIIDGDDPIVLSALVDVFHVVLHSSPEALPTVCDLVLRIWGARTNENPTAAATLVLKLVAASGTLLTRTEIPRKEDLEGHVVRVLADYTTRFDVKCKGSLPLPNVLRDRMTYLAVLVLQICRHAKPAMTEAAQLLILKPIRAVLSEYSPSSNDVYWVLTCLELVPVELWSNALDEAEVKVLVNALNANDESTRLASLRLFKKADPQTLKMHFEALSDGNESQRALEVARIMEDSGEGYAKRIRQILNRREKDERRRRKKSGERPTGAPVLEDVVSAVLPTLRDRDVPFQAAFAEAIINSLQKHSSNPTLMLIAAAVSCEYAEAIPIPAGEIIQVLSSCVSDATPAIQEALLVAILRVAVMCDDIPPRTVETVQALKSTAGRHISRRCDQFEALANDRTTLRRLSQSPSAQTLPGFLSQVETHFMPSKSPPASPPQPPSSPGSGGRKLRYNAYESPGRPIDKFTRSTSASSSRSQSSASNTRNQHPLERTVTPGELALLVRGASLGDTSVATNLEPEDQMSPDTPSTSYRSDLIAFDSPARQPAWQEHVDSDFGPPPEDSPTPTPTSPETFDELWRKLGDSKDIVVRGWCSETPAALIERIKSRSLDMMTFHNDTTATRAFIRTGDSFAVLLCRDGDDGSCLWILKSPDADTKAMLRELLQESG